MNKTILDKRPHLIPPIIATVLLLGALGRWPYGYYQLLRWITCAAAIWVALLAYAWQKKWAVVSFGIIAVLFNPLIPIHLTREIWQPIDLLCAALFIVTTFTLRRAGVRESKYPKTNDPLKDEPRLLPSQQAEVVENASRCLRETFGQYPVSPHQSVEDTIFDNIGGQVANEIEEKSDCRTKERRLKKRRQLNKSIESPIPIDADTRAKGIAKELAHLRMGFGKQGEDWRVNFEGVVAEDNRIYDILVVNFPNGKKQKVYFDISSCLGKFGVSRRYADG